MQRIMALLILGALVAPMPVSAADTGVRRSTGRHGQVTTTTDRMRPFPLSRRARDIRLADSCWRGCQVRAGRAFQTCLRRGRLTDCVVGNDAADRYCLRRCRMSGGPYVTLTD